VNMEVEIRIAVTFYGMPSGYISYELVYLL
jgi:hypothetical protein